MKSLDDFQPCSQIKKRKNRANIEILIVFFMLLVSFSLMIFLFKISLFLSFLTGLMVGYSFLLFILLLLESIQSKNKNNNNFNDD